MKLAYQAFDRVGKAVADTIEAANATEASDRLRRQGLFVSQIVPATEHPSTGSQSGQRFRKPKGRLKSLAMFTRQLQVLVATGTPLVQSLGALERQSEDPAWRAIIADIRKRVDQPLRH